MKPTNARRPNNCAPGAAVLKTTRLPPARPPRPPQAPRESFRDPAHGPQGPTRHPRGGRGMGPRGTHCTGPPPRRQLRRSGPTAPKRLARCGASEATVLQQFPEPKRKEERDATAKAQGPRRRRSCAGGRPMFHTRPGRRGTDFSTSPRENTIWCRNNPLSGRCPPMGVPILLPGGNIQCVGVLWPPGRLADNIDRGQTTHPSRLFFEAGNPAKPPRGREQVKLQKGNNKSSISG